MSSPSSSSSSSSSSSETPKSETLDAKTDPPPPPAPSNSESHQEEGEGPGNSEQPNSSIEEGSAVIEEGEKNKGEGDEGEKEEGEEEEAECGFCLFMKGGGCKDPFIAWEKCVEEAEKKGEDVAEKCFEVTSILKKCMDAHADYYEPILRAEQAMADVVSAPDSES